MPDQIIKDTYTNTSTETKCKDVEQKRVHLIVLVSPPG